MKNDIESVSSRDKTTLTSSPSLCLSRKNDLCRSILEADLRCLIAETDEESCLKAIILKRIDRQSFSEADSPESIIFKANSEKLFEVSRIFPSVSSHAKPSEEKLKNNSTPQNLLFFKDCHLL